MRILLDFGHGLGDAVQLTAVIRHLRHYHPQWTIDVRCGVGKHTAFTGLADTVFISGRDRIDRGRYEMVHELMWDECSHDYADAPSTKTVQCLRDVMALDPIERLLSYQISPSAAVRQTARVYLGMITGKRLDLDRYPAVVIHARGNTSAAQKDMPDDVLEQLVDQVVALGRTAVVLDWDGRQHVTDRRGVYCPDAGDPMWGGTGTGDAAAIAALIQLSEIFVGVDSGPLHVSGSTTTRSIALWTGHHPVRYMDLCSTMLHLLPASGSDPLAGPNSRAYFTAHYQHHYYRDLTRELLAAVQSLILERPVEGAWADRSPPGLTVTGYTQAYYDEHRQAGLDYAVYGDWQRDYGSWIVDALGWRSQVVLDVGCACGSLTRGLRQAGASADGCDCSEYMIALGRRTWPDMQRRLHIADACHLHQFATASYDAVHTHQVAEHWSPDLVPHILTELARVTRPGGLLWMCLDTQELYDRQGRDPAREDPTHVCIRPRQWWLDHLAGAGWRDFSDFFSGALLGTAGSYLKRYDWDWIVSRRPGAIP